MRDLAAPVVLVVQLAPVARMRLPSLAVPVGPAVMLAWPVMVRPGLMGLPALRCHAMVVLAAPAALVAVAQTAALVEQAGLAVVVLVRPAGLVWLPRAALAVSVALAVLGSMQAV
jgi:hypothetical protein